jgi:hypothetical protein
MTGSNEKISLSTRYLSALALCSTALSLPFYFLLHYFFPATIQSVLKEYAENRGTYIPNISYWFFECYQISYIFPVLAAAACILLLRTHNPGTYKLLLAAIIVHLLLLAAILFLAYLAASAPFFCYAHALATFRSLMIVA